MKAWNLFHPSHLSSILLPPSSLLLHCFTSSLPTFQMRGKVSSSITTSVYYCANRTIYSHLINLLHRACSKHVCHTFNFRIHNIYVYCIFKLYTFKYIHIYIHNVHTHIQCTHTCNMCTFPLPLLPPSPPSSPPRFSCLFFISPVSPITALAIILTFLFLCAFFPCVFSISLYLFVCVLYAIHHFVRVRACACIYCKYIYTHIPLPAKMFVIATIFSLYHTLSNTLYCDDVSYHGYC